MLAALRNLLSGGRSEPLRGTTRERLAAPSEPAVIYAIGDVHGCLDLLTALEAAIIADADGRPGEKWIVMLGDYVDRGPKSAQVIDHLLRDPPPGFTRVTLCGNHEAAMLAFLDDPEPRSSWLEFGGIETLASYGIAGPLVHRGGSRQLRDAVASYVPDEHRAFLAGLPISLETPAHLFVHAGVRPGIPWARQADEDLFWFRDDYSASFAEFGKLVIHGHTPLQDAFLSRTRIGIDTGAYLTGRLSAVRLLPGSEPTILSTGGAAAALRTR
jgi:serine/threonine protein phosphatase 1